MKQFFCLALLALAFSCTDPILVGSELLSSDRSTVGQTTTVPFTTTTVRDDSLITVVYDAETEVAAPLGSFTIGSLQDAVFGSWDHSVYLTPNLPNLNGFPVVPSFVGAGPGRIDSIVIILPLDTSRFLYGPGTNFPVEVNQLAAPFEVLDNTFSTLELPTVAENLSVTTDFTPSKEARFLSDTIYTNGDSILRPHVRLRLNQAFVDRLEAGGEAIFATEDAFLNFFPGVEVKISAPSDALISFRPRSNTTVDFSGFNFYYRGVTDNDTLLRLPFETWLPSYQRDYAGSLAENLLAGTEDDEISLVSGQASLMTEIRLTDLSSLANKVVNQAQFTFSLRNVDGYDYEDFEASEFLGLYYRDEDGVLQPTVDREALTGGRAEDIDQFLGGFLDEADADGNRQYRLNLTLHMQRILDGDFPPVLYIRNIPVDADPERAILSGRTSTNNPATLTVTFTDIE